MRGGFPVTDFNVSLPWTKMVVLNPGVNRIGRRDQPLQSSQLLDRQYRRSDGGGVNQQCDHRDMHSLDLGSS